MTAPTTQPTTEGTFAKTPLPNVFLFAREKRMTGSFVVRNPPAVSGGEEDDGVGESIVVLEQGAIVAAELPRFSQNLAWVLHELGLLTDDGFVKVQQALDAPGAQEIPTLLRLRAADPKTLEAALREQFRRKVAALFGNAKGTYAYYAGVDLLSGEARAKAPEDVFPIVWRGIQAAPPSDDALAAVLAKVGGRGVRLREGHEFDRFEFGAELGLAATQLRTAASSVEQLVGLAPDAALVRSMVYLLALTKQIEAVTLTPDMAKPASPAASASVTAPRIPSDPAPKTNGSLIPPPNASLIPAPNASIPPPEGPPVDPKVKEAKTHLGRLQHMTYFDMFDLAPSASMEEIRARFPKFAAAWHPDRVTTPEQRTIYQEIFTLYNQVFNVLTNDEARAEYEERMAGGGGTIAAQKKVDAVIDGVEKAHRAEIYYNQKRFAECEEMCRDVLTKHNPDDIAVNVLLCRTLLETNPGPNLEEIITRLAKIIKTVESNDASRYLMGLALKFRGDKRAPGLFKQALEINPNNMEAQREFNLYQSRREAQIREKNSLGTKITNMWDTITGSKKKN